MCRKAWGFKSPPAHRRRFSESCDRIKPSAATFSGGSNRSLRILGLRSKYQTAMTRYEKLSLVLTTLGIGAAVYIGFVQNSINQKLVDINYDPSLSITYDKPANERSSGLLLTNSGKTSITLYNVTLFAHSITDKNRSFASSSTIETVISPGSTVNVGGPDFLFATENIVRTRGE